jgi:predicted acylesterase/phospholipase RssA
MDASSARIANTRRPKVAIALGGGVRGIAHVLTLEALDEMGICRWRSPARPCCGDGLPRSQGGCVRRGALTRAVAGSMAIPRLLRPVLFGDEMLIDGGAVSPLSYDLRSPRGRRGRRDVWWSDCIDARCRANHARSEQRSKNQTARTGYPRMPKAEHFGVLDFSRANQIPAATEGSEEHSNSCLGSG